jgi:hypothetical protein
MALTIACARIVEQSSDSVELQPSGLYAAACRRIPGSILLAIVAAVASIPLLLLLPLGAYVYGRWLVSWVALLVEGTGPVASLGRSWDLTRRSWWHTIAIGFAATLIIGVLSGLISSIFQGIGAILSSVAGAPVIGAILTSLGGAISGPLMEPFSAALLVVLYYELRARREGFDLEQRARQMTSPA